MKSRVNSLHILTYSLLNWITICVAYPIVVHPDPFIGIVYVLGLLDNVITLIGLIIANELILKKKIKNDNYYYLTIFFVTFLINQLSYLATSGRIPVFDLNDNLNKYYEGENMLFTLSSIISSVLIFGIIYLWKNIINSPRSSE